MNFRYIKTIDKRSILLYHKFQFNKYSYREWSRDWPYDTQQPAAMQMVLNPADLTSER
jgi:hypothetical protein